MNTDSFITSFTPICNKERHETTNSKPEVVIPIGNDELIIDGSFIRISDFEQTVPISSHPSSKPKLEPVKSSSDSDLPVSSDCLVPFSTMDVSALVSDYCKLKREFIFVMSSNSILFKFDIQCES